MTRKIDPPGSITKPLLQELMNRNKGNKPNTNSPAIVKPQTKQPEKPALYEDPGGGYNSDFTFPQE